MTDLQIRHTIYLAALSSILETSNTFPSFYYSPAPTFCLPPPLLLWRNGVDITKGHALRPPSSSCHPAVRFHLCLTSGRHSSLRHPTVLLMIPDCQDEYALYRAHGLSLEGPVSIDIRSARDFAQGHIHGSTSIPLHELKQRLFELPAPYSGALRLLGGSSEELAKARELLAERRYVVEAEVPEDRWRVETQLATGCASRPVWEASPFLKQVLQVQSKNWLRGYPSGGVALDLGCGPGREAVLLAQRLGSAWRVIACDNHEAALRRTEWLATKEGVKVETLQVNLRKDSILHMQADLVHGCRFLDRPLLEDIRKHLVRPGGLVVWSTFLQGSSQIRNGRSLEEGELADVFERDGTFRVLQDEKGVLTTGSGDAEANFFVAQRLTQQHV